MSDMDSDLIEVIVQHRWQFTDALGRACSPGDRALIPAADVPRLTEAGAVVVVVMLDGDHPPDPRCPVRPPARSTVTTRAPRAAGLDQR